MFTTKSGHPHTQKFTKFCPFCPFSQGDAGKKLENPRNLADLSFFDLYGKSHSQLWKLGWRWGWGPNSNMSRQTKILSEKGQDIVRFSLPYLQDRPASEGLFFGTVTLTTVGYGHLTPSSFRCASLVLQICLDVLCFSSRLGFSVTNTGNGGKP